MESINIHTFLEAVGLLTVAVALLVPFYGTIWEVSKWKYLKEQAAKRAAEEVSQ